MTIQEEYFEKVVMPYFKQFQCQPIEMGVRKIHGEFLFATEKFCKKILGVSDSSDLISRSEELLSDSCPINRKINLFCCRIHDAQVKSPAVYDTLLDNVRTDGCISLTTDIPVFDSAGNCIATRFLTRPVSVDNFNFQALESFKKKFDNCGVFLKNVFPIKLSYKDEIILGLLLLDYSQHTYKETKSNTSPPSDPQY